MIELPSVTLLMIETREHKLASMAIEDCIQRAKFGEVVICSDKIEPWHAGLFHFSVPTRFVPVEDWPSKEGWSRFLWNEAPRHIRTSHVLAIQWDSWIVDETMWCDRWLEYDYIGAPWWYTDGLNVGNGGFSLRSTALMRFLAKNRDKFPCVNSIDDDQLCRKYRIQLQTRHGFTWAPEDIALDFSFECVRPDPKARHFGFHAMFNWPKVLSEAELHKRIRIAGRSKYIRGGYIWQTLCKEYPRADEIADAPEAVAAE